MPTLNWLNRAAAEQALNAVPFRTLQLHSTHGDLLAGENMLIQGDNLDALKALLPFYQGRIKCIFIDPPYNTKSAFEHYDDNLEHSQWLSLMYPRLVLLRELLSEDGSIWVTIDDNEGHYLKVLMDEVFGRGNFVANVVWQKKFAPQNDAKLIDPDHDQVLVCAKNIAKTDFRLLPRTDEMNARYKNPDNDPRGPWTAGDSLRKEFREYAFYEVVTPAGRKVTPPPGSSWRFNKEEVPKLIADNRLWFGADGQGVPRIKRFLSEVKDGVIAQTVWLQSAVGNTQEAKKEVIALNANDIFDTPKPERLIQRILHIATNPGDLILDCFLGSGTTAAVAHKMGRRWIGIEMGEHARTHCLPRLEKVLAGEQGGISKAVNWQGGGGFQFFTLGEPVFTAQGRIAPHVRFDALARFIWLKETQRATERRFDSPLLGVHEGTAYYLLYNGILGDKRPESGNVLTREVLAAIHTLLPHDGPKVIYGESVRLGEAHLKAAGITFKHIPYDVGAG